MELVYKTLPVLASLALFSAQLNKIAHAEDVIVLDDETGAGIDVGSISTDRTTVGQLKSILENRTGIEVNRLRLATTNGLLSSNEQLLSEYLGTFDNRLFIKICSDLQDSGAIFIDFGDNKTELVVQKNKTLGWLKKKTLGEVNMNRYRVFFQGKELTDNSRTLGELQFYKGAYVVMLRRDKSFRVNVVHPDVREREYEITLETSVADLRRIMKQSGLDTSNRLLLHRHRVMEDNTRLIGQSIHPFHNGFEVQIADKLDQSGNKITLYHKEQKGIEHFDVMVKSSTTVAELKQFAFKADNSIPVQEMKLRLANSILTNDSSNLAKFNLFKGAWIQVSR